MTAQALTTFFRARVAANIQTCSAILPMTTMRPLPAVARRSRDGERTDMELSDELFEDIRKTMGLAGSEVGEPPIAAAAKDRAKMRRASRSDASRTRAEIEIPDTPVPRRMVRLIDLGRRGASFFDNHAWSAGQKFVLHLPRTPKHLIPLLCIVRNVRPVEDWLRIGAEFINYYESAAIAIARDDLGAEGSVEVDSVRRAPRTRFKKAPAPAQLHTYEFDTAGPILEADVVDLSDGGAGLLCAHQLPPGRKLMVRLCPPGGKTMTRMAEVVSCRRNDAGGYRIGTRFIEYKPGGARSLPQVLFGWLRG
jgi:hypothetical protein